MKKEKSTASKIVSWIFIIILLFAIYKLIGIYKLHYFNGFTKAEANMGISEFYRDSEVKYSKSDSYKIISDKQNDAAFYKEIEVKPNTTYRVSCMIKTQDVVPSAKNTDGGANIGLIEQAEISKSITGTNEWQKVEMMFNSQDRTTVKIGFRLGGNSGTAQGTAWFSDFKLEKGLTVDDTKWKVGCFIFKNIDVTIDGQRMNFSMSLSDIESVKSNMQRFKTACKTLSKDKMTVDYEIQELNETITTISYSDEHGYYIDPYDVNTAIENIALDNEYDYIFIVLRMGNDDKAIPVNEWIGLRKHGFIWSRIFKC